MMVAVLRESEQEAKRGPKMSLKMSRGTPPREQIICSLHSHAGNGARAWFQRRRCLPQGPTRLMTAFSGQHDHFLRSGNLEGSDRGDHCQNGDEVHLDFDEGP